MFANFLTCINEIFPVIDTVRVKNLSTVAILNKR